MVALIQAVLIVALASLFCALHIGARRYYLRKGPAAFRLNFRDKQAQLRCKFVGSIRPTLPEHLISNETIRLDGAVEPSGELLAAPLSRQPCLAYRVVLVNGTGRTLALERDPSGMERWVKSGQPFEIDQRCADFVLSAGDTQVLVRSGGAKQLGLGSLSEHVSFDDLTRPEVVDFLRTQCMEELARPDAMLREYVLLPKKRVSVVGLAERRYRSAPVGEDYRGLSTQWVLDPGNNGELVVTENC